MTVLMFEVMAAIDTNDDDAIALVLVVLMIMDLILVESDRVEGE
jgi:hypothetical protein